MDSPWTVAPEKQEKPLKMKMDRKRKKRGKMSGNTIIKRWDCPRIVSGKSTFERNLISKFFKNFWQK